MIDRRSVMGWGMAAVAGLWAVGCAGVGVGDASVAAVADAADASADRAAPVGRALVVYADPERPAWTGEGERPLATVVWYPAEASAGAEEWRGGPFVMGHSAPGAAFAEGAEGLPLVVLSHGTGGAAAQLAWLAERLAAEGFVVAAVNHHGNTAFEEAYLPHGFVLWWERARDVSAVIDALLADERFAGRIDASRIGVGGFSLGGYTTLLVAGARTDRERWARHCEAVPGHPACRPPPEAPFALDEMERILALDPVAAASLARAGASYRDPRVRAAYALAPALAPVLDEASLRGVEVPVRIVVGERDDQVDADRDARPVARAIPGAEFEALRDVGHYTFLAPCTPEGRSALPDLCADAPGVDRVAVHRAIAADALAFFRRALGDGPGPAARPANPHARSDGP